MGKKARPEAYTAIQAMIGSRVLWARELVFPNATEFAELLGVHPSTLSKIEGGKRAPSVFNVIEIANRLRVTVDYILRGQMSGVDEELRDKLVALHPELVLPDARAGTGMARAGTDQGGDMPLRPRRRRSRMELLARRQTDPTRH